MIGAPYRPSNAAIADVLDEVADLLRAQEASEYRVRAYREAASHLRKMKEPVIEVLDREGHHGLVALPTIGRTIATAIEEMAWRGRWGFLDRLRGEVSPVELIMTVPGIGEALATRVHDELGVETLEDLELAAHDGRLEKLPGFGPRRVRAVRELLGAQLSRSTRRRARRIREGERLSDDELHPRPSVDVLLRLDRAYREQAERGELPRISPRRFNPKDEDWLPVWHTSEEDVHFTLLFSNTATAHRLGKTHEWVVVYWEHEGHEDQATVVTERRGPLRGRRVVRGRERECLAFWARESEKEREARRYARD